MVEQLLSDRQKDLLRSIVPGLQNGTVKTDWYILFQGSDIAAMVGVDNELSKLWKREARPADFVVFERCGFFIEQPSKNPSQKNYVLIEQAIIKAVENNFSPSLQKTEQHMHQRPLAKDPKTVFVVHGRNLEARDALFSFLGAIGLRPLEWSEAIVRTGKSSPYIGDILETAFSEARAIVVLMTPDDEARLRPIFHGENEPPYETDFTPQARPNVLFEAGMAMGYSGEGTILVELGELRPFSDIAGRHVIKLNNSTERRQDLAQRLMLAGCEINLEGTAWHTAGNFTAIEMPKNEDETEKISEIVEVLQRVVEDDEIWDCGFIELAKIKGEIIARTQVDELRQMKKLDAMGWTKPQSRNNIISLSNSSPPYIRVWEAINDETHLVEIARELIQVNVQIHDLELNDISLTYTASFLQ